MKSNTGDGRCIILENFKFTGRDEDYVMSDELREFVKDAGINISMSKLKDILEINGAVYCNRLKNTSGSGYIGVKRN